MTEGVSCEIALALEPPTGVAIRYYKNHGDALFRFVIDVRVEFSS